MTSHVSHNPRLDQDLGGGSRIIGVPGQLTLSQPIPVRCQQSYPRAINFDPDPRQERQRVIFGRCNDYLTYGVRELFRVNGSLRLWQVWKLGVVLQHHGSQGELTAPAAHFNIALFEFNSQILVGK